MDRSFGKLLNAGFRPCIITSQKGKLPFFDSGSMRIGIEPLKRLDFFANPQQNLKRFQPLSQVMEHRQLGGPGIGANTQRDQLPALLPQVDPQRVLVIPAEVAHHLLDVHRQIHRGFVNRQVFVPGQDLPSG